MCAVIFERCNLWKVGHWKTASTVFFFIVNLTFNRLIGQASGKMMSNFVLYIFLKPLQRKSAY